MYKLILPLFSFLLCAAVAPQSHAQAPAIDEAVPRTAGKAKMLAAGDVMAPYTFPDQFGEEHTLAASTRAVLISSEKKISQAINAWLAAKDEGYLADKKLEYVSDISPMPAPITKLFALPKMKKQTFPILLNRDDSFKDSYPRQDKKMALFILDENHTVTAIEYVANPKEVEALLP